MCDFEKTVNFTIVISNIRNRTLVQRSFNHNCFFVLTKNLQIFSALQFLLRDFIRISEKNFLAYFVYSRGFFSLSRMKEQRKNQTFYISTAPGSAK